MDNEPWEGPTGEATLSVCCSGDLVTLALWAAMISIWSSPAVTARSSRIFIGHLTSESDCQLSRKSVPGVAHGVYLSAFSSFLAATLMIDDPLLPLRMSLHSPVLSGCFDRHLEMCCLWQPASKMCPPHHNSGLLVSTLGVIPGLACVNNKICQKGCVFVFPLL